MFSLIDFEVFECFVDVEQNALRRQFG